MKKEQVSPVTEEEVDNIDVTISTADGELVCKLLSIFTVSGRDYCAVMPRDPDGEENRGGIVYLYRYHEDSNGIPTVEFIPDDDEYSAVSRQFDELLDEQM